MHNFGAVVLAIYKSPSQVSKGVWFFELSLSLYIFMTSLLYLFYQNLIRKLFLLKPIIKKPQELWHKFFPKGSITDFSVEDSCRKTSGVPLTVFVNTGEFCKKCSWSPVSTQGKEVRASVVTHQNKFNWLRGHLVSTTSIRFLHQHKYIYFQSSCCTLCYSSHNFSSNC